MEGSSRINKRFRRICVFCGSSSGNKSIFSDAALDLGKELVERRIDLVYGGGSFGLMGLISKTVYNGGCHVLGCKSAVPAPLGTPLDVNTDIGSGVHVLFGRVIPTALMSLEISGQTVGDVKTVADMHERKAEMARQADAFIALPGGYGTLEELLEMITWSQLGIHEKPVGLLNVDGYYNSLLALFDRGVEEGFIKPTARHIVVSAPTGRELIRSMEEYVPMHDSVVPRQSWEKDRGTIGYSEATDLSR
eukprot:Gb_24266 [translate_table: standard]